MKKLSLILATAFAISASAQSLLTTKSDSLNYALGVVTGSGMRQQTLAADTVDINKVEQFADGFTFAFRTLDKKQQQELNASMFVYLMSTYVVDQHIFGDKTLLFSNKSFQRNLANSLLGKEMPLDFNQSSAYIDSVMKSPLDSGSVRTQAQVDSVNLAFSIVNAYGIRYQLLNADTTTKDIKTFLKLYKKADKSYAKNKLYVDGMRASFAMYRQLTAQQYLMNDTSIIARPELVRQGIVDALTIAEHPLMPIAAATEYFSAFIQSKQNVQAVNTMDKDAEFLAKNAKEEGMNVTSSGLQYFVNRLGEGSVPTANSVVRVHYEGRLLDGTLFDSSIKRGEPLEFPLNRVIKGWTEGLQLMPVGSKFTFFIPYHLGYGERGAGNVIPPYATLIFEIELLEIIK